MVDKGCTQGIVAVVVPVLTTTTAGTNPEPRGRNVLLLDVEGAYLYYVYVDFFERLSHAGMFASGVASVLSSRALLARAIAVADIVVFNAKSELDSDHLASVSCASMWAYSQTLKSGHSTLILFRQRGAKMVDVGGNPIGDTDPLAYFPEGRPPTTCSHPKYIESISAKNTPPLMVPGETPGRGRDLQLDINGLMNRILMEIPHYKGKRNATQRNCID